MLGSNCQATESDTVKRAKALACLAIIATNSRQHIDVLVLLSIFQEDTNMSTKHAYRVLAAIQTGAEHPEIFTPKLVTVKVFIEHALLHSDAAWADLEAAVAAELSDPKPLVWSPFPTDIQIVNTWRLHQEDVPPPPAI